MVVVTVARRPLAASSVAANVLDHGAGALNIDASRITASGTSPSVRHRETARRTGNAPVATVTAAESDEDGRIMRRGDPATYMVERRAEHLGRWPANLLLSHAAGCRVSGTKRVRTGVAVQRHGGGQALFGGIGPRVYAEGLSGTGAGPRPDATYAGADGFEEVPAWECASGCPHADLEAQEDGAARYFMQVGVPG